MDENPDLYDEGHIPGAVKLHWRDDLQDELVRDVVSKEEFERLMGERGIANDTTVVLYGDKNNWFAAYAYWYLKIYGHEDVRLLDGGRQKWIEEGRDFTLAASAPTPTTYVGAGPRRVDPRSARRRPRAASTTGDRPRRRAQPAGVLGRAHGAARIRAGGRVSGRAHSRRAVDPVGDRRPGRRHLQEPDELREIYEAKGVTPDKEVRAYCRIGERSAHTWFVLRELLGYEQRQELRRLVDGVGQPRRRPDRALASSARTRLTSDVVADALDDDLRDARSAG